MLQMQHKDLYMVRLGICVIGA